MEAAVYDGFIELEHPREITTNHPLHDFESLGREFEPLRARHELSCVPARASNCARLIL
jgi:hypothetical protein